MMSETSCRRFKTTLKQKALVSIFYILFRFTGTTLIILRWSNILQDWQPKVILKYSEVKPHQEIVSWCNKNWTNQIRRGCIQENNYCWNYFKSFAYFTVIKHFKIHSNLVLKYIFILEKNKNPMDLLMDIWNLNTLNLLKPRLFASARIHCYS